jgi:peroxiredoxin
MKSARILSAALFTAGALTAADSSVNQAVARFETAAAKAPAAVAIEFRLRAAEALKDRYPEISRKLVDEAVAAVRGSSVVPTSSTPRLLKELAPDQKFQFAAIPRSEPPPAALSKKIGTMRSLPTDADRAKLVLEFTPEIHALPAGPAKLSLARGLAGVSTEGDLGKPALTAVVSVLAEAARQLDGVGASPDGWLETASLVRYELVDVPVADPSLDAANALLELRERMQSEAGFTLTALDGKTYTLDSLRGRVVLLNFWATWCPPCRKEMPDMEKLYRKFESSGLTVLAVSDEKRETVEGFLAKTPYRFPVLLDTDRKVHQAFGVEGIPKSFIFDREGRMAALAIDMRTESQFLALLKKAGLE